MLVLSQPDATVESLMSSDIVSINVNADQEELAELVSRYDYFVVPVVNDANELLGVVTVDDVLDIFEEEVTEDIQRLGGSEPLDQPYFAVSAFQIVRKRIGWLLLLFVASTLSGEVIRMFQNELDLVVALGFFITLITGTGGNAGSQTVATIIRAITLDEVRLSNLIRCLAAGSVGGADAGAGYGRGGHHSGLAVAHRLRSGAGGGPDAAPGGDLVHHGSHGHSHPGRPLPHRSHGHQRPDDCHHRRCHRPDDLLFAGQVYLRNLAMTASTEIEIPELLVQNLRAANHVAVLTGAGISAESGVPTFREAQTGLWAQYDPQELATPQAFQRNPKLVWEWYAWRRELVGQAQPNPGHLALVELAALVPKFTLITQNVDGLHQRAGSQNVVCLHGNITETKCYDHNHMVPHWPESDRRTANLPYLRQPGYGRMWSGLAKIYRWRR
jgi:hypothetical protein